MQFLIRLRSNSTGIAKALSTGGTFSSSRRRGSSENRLERKRQCDQRKQEVKGLESKKTRKKGRKDAKIGRIWREGREKEQ